MKKIIALLLALCLVVTVFAACGSTTETAADTADTTAADDTAASTEEAAAPAEEFTVEDSTEYVNEEAPSGYMIGWAYLPPSDTLSSAFLKMLNYCCEVFDCELCFQEMTAYDTDSTIALYENMLTAGCDAIIPLTPYAAVVEKCNEKGVYFLPTCCEVSEELLPVVQASDYYLGNICENEVQSGYTMAEYMYNAGCRNVALCGMTPGAAKSHDDRVRGFEQFAEEHEDFVIVVENTDYSNASRYDEVVASWGTQIDGICATGGNTALPAAIIAAGLEDSVKYATIDIQGDVRTDLDTGMCCAVAGGQYPDLELTFVCIYNALASGVKVIQDFSQPLYRPYTWMTTAEEYDEYIAAFEGDTPVYDATELKAMCLAYNPDATADSVWAQLQEYAANYGLADVLERHPIA